VAAIPFRHSPLALRIVGAFVNGNIGTKWSKKNVCCCGEREDCVEARENRRIRRTSNALKGAGELWSKKSHARW